MEVWYHGERVLDAAESCNLHRFISLDSSLVVKVFRYIPDAGSAKTPKKQREVLGVHIRGLMMQLN